MKIGIIGLGYVGRAVQASWGDPHETVFHDPAIGGSTDIADMLDVDAMFICVPTPERELDQGCDSDIVGETINKLKGQYAGPIIVKSTTEPEFWHKYADYPNIIHVPEFLTAKNAIRDYEFPKIIFIGGSDPAYQQRVKELLELSVHIDQANIVYTDNVTASLIKYYMNTFLATKVTLLNQFYLLCNATGGNWESFSKMLVADSYRMGYTHNQVPGPDSQLGYGGACFPKDVRAMIASTRDVGVSLGLLEAVDHANKHLRSDV
jgi:UDPglucose 6-dehydrogenase